jgi:hypothetical protein
MNSIFVTHKNPKQNILINVTSIEIKKLVTVETETERKKETEVERNSERR